MEVSDAKGAKRRERERERKAGSGADERLSHVSHRGAPPARTPWLEAGLLRAVFERAGCGLCVVGPDNSVMAANATWLALTGLSASQATGRDILDLFPDSREQAARACAQARAGRAAGVPRYCQRIAGRDICWESSVSPLPMATGMGLLITAREVPTASEHEAELREANEHLLAAGLRQMELLEQREDLLSAVSHDLRNPLTVIQGQAQRLKRGLEQGLPPDRLRAGAEAIDTAARSMNAMIQDLVDQARLEAGQLRMDLMPVDLGATLPRLIADHAEALQAGRIQLQLPPDLPPVCADPGRMERILLNLLSNAIKYSAPGTPITVSARQEGRFVITSVTDRGPGIPPEQMPRLFQRFYRTEAGGERREGVGLGLYISRKLVQAQGGEIWAESEVGVGSTFSFSLPLVGLTLSGDGAMVESCRGR